MCGFSFAPAGKQTTAQTPGDCHQNQCDGAGHVVNAVDNTDIPVDTNQCTTAICTNGTPSTPPVAAGATCTQSGGVECNGAGACVQCLVETECPGTDTECQQRTCTAGACGLVDIAVGTPTSTQTAGDCHTNECDGNGNIVSVVDDTDVPGSNNTCAPGMCSNGTPSIMDAAPGTACSQNGGVECDGSGDCVQCVTAADCGTDTLCQTHTCTAGKCGVSDVTAGTPEGTQTSGDCHTNECDGNGNLVDEVDNTDVPGGGANPCLAGICTNGTPSVGNAAQGTACSTSGGVLCDGAGVCTQTVTVVRVGTGSGALSGVAAPAFLETYYPLAGASPIRVTALPITASGTNAPLLVGGTATTEGALTRSGDGHYLVLGGYNIAAGGTTTGTAVPRVVGRVDAAGNVDTSTSLPSTAFVGSSIRGATSVDGTNFWASGTSTGTGGGVWYLPLGATATGGTQLQITDTPNNMRQVAVFAGALYGTSGSSGFTGVLGFGGLPTAAPATATLFPSMSTANPGGFVVLDLNPSVTGVDTLFVCDSGSPGLQRWTFNGTAWAKDAAFTPVTGGCIGVAGWSTGSGVILVAAMSAGALQRVDVPTTGAPTATPMVTAATNTVYRGAALAPH